MEATKHHLRDRLPVRWAGTVLAAVAFIGLCWSMANSVYGDTRMLAGPVGFFQTQSMTDKVVGSVAVAIRLPCIFAVGVRRSVGTVALSVLGILGWLAVGFWIEAMASC
jgi:hypothetical protein